MPSAGAPPVSGDPRLLVEIFDDPDLMQQTPASGYAGTDLSRGRYLLNGTTSGPARVHAGASGATRAQLANGLPFWRLSDNATTQLIGNIPELGFPLYTKQSLAPALPPAFRRWKRFTIEAAIFRDSIGVGGGFAWGLKTTATLALWSNINQTGIMFGSRDTDFGGNWHIAYRFTAGAALLRSA